MGRRVSLPKRSDRLSDSDDKPVIHIELQEVLEAADRASDARRLVLKAMPTRTPAEDAEYAPLKAAYKAHRAYERRDEAERARVAALPPVERARAHAERKAATKAQVAQMIQKANAYDPLRLNPQPWSVAQPAHKKRNTD